MAVGQVLYLSFTQVGHIDFLKYLTIFYVILHDLIDERLGLFNQLGVFLVPLLKVFERLLHIL